MTDLLYSLGPGDSGVGADRCAAAAVCGQGTQERSRGGPARAPTAQNQLAG